MSDFITLVSSLLPRSARVVSFRGTEAISRLYRFEVFVTAPAEDVDFDLSEVIGTKARLVLGAGVEPLPCFFSGIVGDVELIEEHSGRALLRAVVVPRLAELALSHHSRIFTEMSAIDVIKSVLEENGVTDFESHVGASVVEEHICQYRESDLDFISRWMEREGIRYYFEHGEDGEKLILTDDAAYPDEPLHVPVRYYPQIAEHWSGAPQSFRAFSSRHTSVSASVKVRDNDYTRPSLKLSGAAPVWSNGSGEVNLHAARFWNPGEGQRLALLRAQERITGQAVFHATGSRLHLHAGFAFELEEHPRAAFNAKYLVTEAHHHGNQAVSLDHWKKLLQIEHDDLYVVEVAAIAAAIQFRPASVTPWPRIYGFEGAVVDGPATSEYAQIDVQGRYNVKLHFDESALKNGKASTLVRMMQPHGGDIEGFHFPLRKGTEVVVSFLGGDPDRPVISGVVPNAINPSAVTSGNYTKNVIQTGGRNRLECEDLSGQERVTLSTPLACTYLLMGSPDCGHHAILKTDGNILIQAGVDLDIIAGGHKHETITGEVTEIYESTKNETVTGAVTEIYESTKSETVVGALTEIYESTKNETVTGAVTETYNSTKTETVVGALTEIYESTKNETVTGAVTEIYESTKSETVTGTVTETYGGLLHQILKASWTVNTTGDVTHTATGDYTITHGGSKTQTISGSTNGFWKGPVFDFYFGNKGTFVAGGYDTWVLGLKDDIIVGAKIEAVWGNKFKTGTTDLTLKDLGAHWFGAKFWYDTLHIQDAATKIASAATEVKDHAVRVVNAGINLFT